MTMRMNALWLVACASLAACGNPTEPAPLPQDRAEPVPFTPVEVLTEFSLADAPGFADQQGGGIFAATTGDTVRLRVDGTRAPLEGHPGNGALPGLARGTFRLGPRSALVDTDTGPFLAESGWLLEPPWRQALGPGLAVTAVTPDGAAWLGHAKGLYRLHGGRLSTLKVQGQSLPDTRTLAVAPVEEGKPGVWLLREGQPWVAVEEGAERSYQVRPADVVLHEGEQGLELAGLGASVAGPAEVWLRTSERLLRRGGAGWREVVLPQKPEQLLGAGRFAWVRAGSQLLLFDADAGTWSAASGVDARALRLLAVDESGCAWARRGTETVALTHGRVPRVLGVYEGMQVVADEVVVRARPAPGPPPAQLTFEVAGVSVPVEGPAYSLGGVEADGTPRPYALVGLPAGLHTLSAVARFADGTEARRTVVFEYLPLFEGALGWEADIRPIHEARCAKCHDAGPGRALSTHALWKENLPLIVEAVRDQRMPADGPLDPQLLSVIQRWAASGANP